MGNNTIILNFNTNWTVLKTCGVEQLVWARLKAFKKGAAHSDNFLSSRPNWKLLAYCSKWNTTQNGNEPATQMLTKICHRFSLLTCM